MAGRWRDAIRRMSRTIVPAAVYWPAGLAVAGGASLASIGTVVAFATMVNRLVSPVSTMQGVGQNVSTSLALFGLLFDVFDLPVDVDGRPGAQPLRVTAGEVSLSGVFFRYQDSPQWALGDIELLCRPGTVTAIVGETGSGKTTLGYLVDRLHEPQQSSVRIDGTDLRDVTVASIADTVGLLAQETYLLRATIRENLLLAEPDATDAELDAAIRAARLDDLVGELPDGYDTMVGERGYRLSGGERQRLAIARMLLLNPPVLILDEATSALDTRTEMAVQEALAALSSGRTTIVIAHRLGTIERADHFVVLDGGRVVERGSHDDLVARVGHYAAFTRPRQAGTRQASGDLSMT